MTLGKKRLTLKCKWLEKKYIDMSVAETYTHIYKNNVWGGKEGEFYSGNTSHSSRLSSAYERMIKKIIREYDVKSICDLGCGDFYIGSKFVDSIEQYFGVDIVSELIEHNQAKYGNEKTMFLCRDIINDDLPVAQMCTVRQVLQHLSNEEILKFFENVKEYQYLLITERVTKNEYVSEYNIDKPHGAGNRANVDSGVYLDKAPFNKKTIEVRRVSLDIKYDMVTVLVQQY